MDLSNGPPGCPSCDSGPNVPGPGVPPAFPLQHDVVFHCPSTPGPPVVYVDSPDAETFADEEEGVGTAGVGHDGDRRTRVVSRSSPIRRPMWMAYRFG